MLTARSEVIMLVMAQEIDSIKSEARQIEQLYDVLVVTREYRVLGRLLVSLACIKTSALTVHIEKEA